MQKRNSVIISCVMCCFIALFLTGCGAASSDSPSPNPSVSITARGPLTPVTIDNFDAMEERLTYTYAQIPGRVAITHPGATELLLDLGLEDRIQATVAPYGAPLKRVAEAYAKLKIMPAKYAPSLEELLEMQPDMIIGWSHHFTDNSFGNVRTWHERGVATYIMPSSLIRAKPTLDSAVYGFLTDMGRIFRVQDKTDAMINNYRSRIGHIETTLQNVSDKKTVLVLQTQANGLFSLYDSSYLVSSMIGAAGGRHIGDTVRGMVGAETVLTYDPDFILFISVGKRGTEDLSDQEAIAQLKQIEELASMRAIRQGNIINLPFFTANNGGIRTVGAIEKIAFQLYPERFE